jgi:hypothetical protein
MRFLASLAVLALGTAGLCGCDEPQPERVPPASAAAPADGADVRIDTGGRGGVDINVDVDPAPGAPGDREINVDVDRTP